MSFATAVSPRRTPARKGASTRAAIVDTALAIARRAGLEALTIGMLAEQLGMSKSGVFAHFGSREELQLAVLKEYAARFIDEVLRPALRRRRGLPRLQAILANWLRLLAREIEQGCLMIAGASEYDDRPGPLRDALVQIVMGWKSELLRAIEAAKAEGHLRADVDGHQLVFEIYGLMLVLHQDARLLKSADSVKRTRAGLKRLIDAARADSRPPSKAARARGRLT
ncbi:MAG: TetR/AcrR family transcriptional regulator [Sutterellaceae bacterium]|nr:TetR/AcrR family transcriptional regulator [Sutterellaceae bacterium]